MTQFRDRRYPRQDLWREAYLDELNRRRYADQYRRDELNRSPFGRDRQQVEPEAGERYARVQEAQQQNSPAVGTRIPVKKAELQMEERQTMPQEEQQARQATPPVESQTQGPDPKTESADNDQPKDAGVDWETMARRLQADMENFRKRQRRQAEEAAQAERERLLRLVLPVADNLARALNHHNTIDDQALRQGIELTQRELNRLLQSEGVSRIETVGYPFDPQWHEALASLPAQGVASNTVVEEIEAGYRLDDKLLRPAKVVVAA